MSGRDLRAFITFHRDAIGASDPSLVSRLVHGKPSGRYKEVNYEKLKAITKLKAATGLQSLEKINTIQQVNKEKKELNLLEQHKIFWKKELSHLNSLYKSKLYELELAQNGLPWEQSTVNECFEEIKDYENFINNDYLTFSKNTVKPVWDLREDIQMWLEESKQQLARGEADASQVSEILESVKLQQKSIIRQLREEQGEIEQDIDILNVLTLIEEDEDNLENIGTGIPEEAFRLTCPYEDLKTSVLNQFELLDKRYETHLYLLNVKYQTVLQNENGGWSEEDHMRFEHILDQYPSDLPNRRSLYIDRFIREMTQFSRREIVEHEGWLLSFASYQNQKVAVCSAWERDRADLLLKVKATFSDAWEVYEKEKEKLENRKRQEEICWNLHEKVEDFQRKKQEAFKLKLEIEEKLKKEQEETIKIEEEKQKKKREIIYDKVKHYKEKKMFESKHKLEEERQRLVELQEEMKEQARKDAERVAFREHELRIRQEAKKFQEQQRIDEEQERQRRLQMLREQVCVNVADDPLRVLQSTEASRGHVLKNKEDDEEEEFELQKPLFSINTFNTNQVVSDPRHRIEQALRNAGLNNTDYARQVLANVKPHRPTRPDQYSSLFKE